MTESQSRPRAMAPEDWKQLRLGDVATFKNGLNFTETDDGEAIKIVSVSDFKRHTKLASTEGLATIRVSRRVQDGDLLASGDLLFVRSNGNKALVGRCLFFPTVSERLAYSGFTIRGRVNRSVLLPEFASQLMRSETVRQQIAVGRGGTGISNLSQDALANISILVPSLKEQEELARVLDATDRAINISERLLEYSRKRKQVLLNELLTGARRLPDRRNQRPPE